MNTADNIGNAGTKVFQFNVTAPAAGTHTFWWQLYSSVESSFNGLTPAISVTVNPAPPPPPPGPGGLSCGQATPDGDWTIDTSGTRATFLSSVANATAVDFWMWDDPGWQDDLVAHPGTDMGGGVWTANLPLNQHTGIGNVYAHAYAFNPTDGWISCDISQFVRLNNGTIQVNSNMPTSWTISCPLANPACPNISSGPNQTTGSYPSKPYSTWTIVPQAIPGFNFVVTPNTSQTFP
jgi:hypothetical protein